MHDAVAELRRLRVRFASGGSVSALVSESLPLARHLEMDDWAQLLEVHLYGFSMNEWKGKDRPPKRKTNPDWGWYPGAAAAEDRKQDSNDEMLRGETPAELEDLLRKASTMLAEKEAGPTSEEAQRARNRLSTFQGDLEAVLSRMRNRVAQFLAEAESRAQGQSRRPAVAQPASGGPAVAADTKTQVFIGHGRSKDWLELKIFLETRLGVEILDFERVSSAGVTTAERLEEMVDAADAAFLVLTAEDKHADGSVGARDNVVHEQGLFQGRLGRRRAIAVLEDGCTEFSNIQGVGQIRFQPGRIAEKFEEVRRVLEREQLV